MSGLQRLDFLIGRWEGRYADQFGERGTLESSLECTKELNGRFLQLRGATRRDGVILNQATEFITFDSKAEKYVSKKMWSYGFIENGEGKWEDDKTLMFQIKFDNPPSDFAGSVWKSFIRRYSGDEIGHGLYTAKEGEEYRLYGETRQNRVQT